MCAGLSFKAAFGKSEYSSDCLLCTSLIMGTYSRLSPPVGHPRAPPSSHLVAVLPAPVSGSSSDPRPLFPLPHLHSLDNLLCGPGPQLPPRLPLPRPLVTAESPTPKHELCTPSHPGSAAASNRAAPFLSLQGLTTRTSRVPGVLLCLALPVP